MNLAFIGNLNGGELLIVLFIILLLFGSSKLPNLARSLGRSLSEFKKGKDEIQKELREGAKEAAMEADEEKKPVENKTA